MSDKILIVTVGGSHQPVVTSIKQVAPDRVIFICSDRSRSQVVDKGSPCEVRINGKVVERLPNIPTQAKVTEQFKPEKDIVLLDDPDNFEQVYEAISKSVRSIKAENESADILANYTAGTKTMSVVLGIVAIDYDLDLYLTRAKRIDLFQIKRGETTERSSVSQVQVERKLRQAIPSFISKYDYPPAITALQQLLMGKAVQPSQQRTIREQMDLCQALESWDCFDHISAWQELQHKMSLFRELGLFLKRVMSSRSKIDTAFIEKAHRAGVDYSIPCHGYELVEDLLLNAERRAYQKRFDDAVGRLYRALELLVQIRLRQAYEIETGSVNLKALSITELRQQYSQNESGIVQLALRESYEFLCKIDPMDPLGQLYKTREKSIIGTLKIRNDSLFAHGFNPITESQYIKVEKTFGGFIREGISYVASSKTALHPIQFPQQFDF